MGDRLPRKLAAILYADVAGYSRLTGEDEEGTHRRLSEYLDVFTTKIQNHDGKVVHFAGDAILAEFSTVSDALICAASVQHDLADRNEELADERKLQFRIGVNLGDIIVDRDDIYGDGVNIAARLESLAEPGGICVSEAVRSSIGKKLPFVFEFLGEQQVKNIAEPVRAYQAQLMPGVELPEPAEQRGPVEPKPAHRRWRPISAATAIVLIAVAGALMWLKPWEPRVEPASVDQMEFPLPDKPSIAVLPFDNLSGDSKQDYLADGISEGIIAALSSVPELFVIARNSTFTYKDKPVKVQQVAEELGVRYVLEGSVQKSVDQLRVTARLIDAMSGNHLWASRFDRKMKDLFAILDDIALKIGQALQVQLTLGEERGAFSRGTSNLEAWSQLQQGRAAYLLFTKENNAKSRRLVQRAVGLDPEYAMAWALLGWTHAIDARYEWSASRAESFKVAGELASKSVMLDDQLAEPYSLLAFLALIGQRFDEAIAHHEKAVAVDPNDQAAKALFAATLTYAGRPREAIGFMERAMRLNPYYPSHYLLWLGRAYRLVGRESEAITALQRAKERMPENWLVPVELVAIHNEAVRQADAETEVTYILKIKPDATVEGLSKLLIYKDPKERNRILDALRNAGLPEHPPLSLPDKPSIAVLPFTNMSDDMQQEYFADGMTDDLITDLSKISGLFVIAGNSSFTYKGKAVDVKDVARDLDVRYVLEGSVRRVGDQVRINAQLIDATTGGHLWADRYDGTLDDVFGLQDQVTSNIAAVLAVQLSASDQNRETKKETASTDAYDEFLKGWNQYLKQTPDSFAQAIVHFGRASAIDPSYSRAYAALAATYWQSWKRFWHEEVGERRWHDARVQAEGYLTKAMKNPTPLAHQLASAISLQRGNLDKSIAEAERSIAIDPNDSEGYIALADALIYSGDAQQGALMVEQAMRLNPHYPPYYLYELGLAKFALGLLDQAVAEFEKAVALNPKDVWAQRMLLATYGKLGRDDEVFRVRENLSRSEFLGLLTTNSASFWHPFQDSENKVRFAEGLRMAGVPD